MKFKIILPSLLLIGALSSCSKWIDIKPKDRLSEVPLFETKEGFLKALNGVYVELGSPVLYGQNLTSTVVDAMAQYYLLSTSTHIYQNFATFNYGHATNKSTFDAIWKRAYAVIVNCNAIIEKADASSGVLAAPYYGIVKGEALAIRAMLHLDLLRLFGPIWSEENKVKPAIPYTATSSMSITPLLSSEVVMNHILSDFTLAAELLETTDPVITEGVRNFDNSVGTNDLHYRQYRINYFAVKALMARAYMWKGDEVNALSLAKEIIQQVQNPAAPIFPFVTNAAATNATKPDRMFSPEVIAAVYSNNRVSVYYNIFAAELPTLNRLSFAGANNDRSRVNELYDDANDHRARIWEAVVQANNTSILTNQRYKDYADAPGRYMIPLLRVSELYLIAAECTDNLDDAKTFLNTVRASRNAVSLSPASLDDLKIAVRNEFRREMLGEGQMFFYYKRTGTTIVPNHAVMTGIKGIQLANYTVPLPDSEISLRN